MNGSVTAGPTYEIQVAGVADGGDRIPDLSPRDAFEMWLAKLRGSKAEQTVSSYHYRLKHFVEWTEEQGVHTVGDLTGWDLESYETHRRERDLAILSLNKEMLTLQNFLEYCARIEVVDEELPNKVDPPDVPKDAHVDETLLPVDRARELLDYYDRIPDVRNGRAHALLALAWYTGARSGALRGLDLRDYHADEQVVEFYHRPRQETPLKNGPDGERMVGLPAHVCEIVDEYIGRHRYDVYDDYGRQPLLASTVGRPSRSAIQSWMYLATIPCHHSPCPHGNDPETCEFTEYTKASQCPSSRSPHQVRTGSITWQMNRQIPIERVSERVNTSVRTLKRHYDKPTPREAFEERRRGYVDRLTFDEGGDSA